MCLLIFLFDFRRGKSCTQTADERTSLLPSTTSNTTASGSATIVAIPPARTPHITPPPSNMPHPRPGSPLRPHLGHRWTSKHLGDFQHPFLPSDKANHTVTACPQQKSSEAQHTLSIDEAPFQTPSSPLPQPSTRRRRDDEVSISTTLSNTHEIDIAPSISIRDDLASSYETITLLLQPQSPQSDRSFDEITADEASMLSSTGWAENTDRLLCYLWFFTRYSFATMGALLNFAREEDETGEWLDGEKVRKRLLELMDGADEHGFVWHEVRRASKHRESEETIARIKKAQNELDAAWQAMRSDLAIVPQPDDGRYCAALKTHLLVLDWTGLTGAAMRPVTRAEIERLSVNAETASEKAEKAKGSRSKVSACFRSGRR